MVSIDPGTELNPAAPGHPTKLDPGPVVDVYRVEHRLSRCGPFQGAPRRAVLASMPDVLRGLGGNRDGITFERGMRDDYLFGAPSLESAASWFKDSVEVLDGCSYVLSHYRVPEAFIVVGRSKLQLAFAPHAAELVERRPCSSLQQVVKAPLPR